MSSSGASVLFVTLAMNQTLFFEAVGAALGQAGKQVTYLCFHERSHEYLIARGSRSFNAFKTGEGDDSVDLSRYAWPSLNLVLSHEKAAFEIQDTDILLRKLRRYLVAAETILEGLASMQVIMVQELGGFLSNVATFYAARRRGVDNIFIEPAFFRGRIAFLRNTFGAPHVAGPRSPQVSEEVRAYLDDAVAKQQVVIPMKDARHYRRPSSKLADPRNIRRLIEKAFDRYVLGKREEFGHIVGHVYRHVRMFASSKVLSKRYRSLASGGRPFVYYPLHVPADVALTIRSPEYLDQLAIIDYLARVIPETHDLFIKEHPALIGAMDPRRMVRLLKLRDNVRLLDPRIPNYEVLQGAAAVVTVNSKSGAEALLLGRPVLALGDAFYSTCDLVYRINALAELPEVLRRVLCERTCVEETAVLRYFQDVWDASWPGELHVPDRENASRFAQSFAGYLARTAKLH